MQELEERIQSEGTVKAGNVLKVDAFLNHQCDVRLFDRMGSAWAAHFAGKHITKILTIEASGIGIACVTAQFFHVPVIFAKKNKTKNISIIDNNAEYGLLIENKTNKSIEINLKSWEKPNRIIYFPYLYRK